MDTENIKLRTPLKDILFAIGALALTAGVICTMLVVWGSAL